MSTAQALYSIQCLAELLKTQEVRMANFRVVSVEATIITVTYPSGVTTSVDPAAINWSYEFEILNEVLKFANN